MNSTIDKLYGMYVKLLGCLRSPFLLVIRLYWGWQFFLTGRGKLMHLDRTTNFFASLHIPAPHLNALMAGCTECFGGLLLLLGLGGRIATVPLIVTMIVAYLTADPDKIRNVFSNPDAFVTADQFLFMLAALIVLIFGPGAFSLDALIRKVRGGKCS
jgi:putative oxidoreductase